MQILLVTDPSLSSRSIIAGMDALDGDDVALSSRGKKAERDIVQFVPFRKFSGEMAGAMLSKVQSLAVSLGAADIVLGGARRASRPSYWLHEAQRVETKPTHPCCHARHRGSTRRGHRIGPSSLNNT